MAADETAVDYVKCPAMEFIERRPIERMPPSIYIDDAYSGPAEKRRVLITDKHGPDKHGPAFFDSNTWSLITTTYQDRIRPIRERALIDILPSLTWLIYANLFFFWCIGNFDDLEDDDNSKDDEVFGWQDVLLILIVLSIWMVAVVMLVLAWILKEISTRSALQEMATELSPYLEKHLGYRLVPIQQIVNFKMERVTRFDFESVITTSESRAVV
jgi:hypothetical protein